MQFAIDLACLASRREYLKLEKWLSDKVRDQGELFVTALIKFLQVISKLSSLEQKRMLGLFLLTWLGLLQRRSGQLVGGSFGKDESHPKATQLPQETIVTILGCLQACAR